MLTDRFPRSGAWLLDRLLSNSPVNRILLKTALKAGRKRLSPALGNGLRRILVVGDLNIGDAVNLQVAVVALMRFFPDARIDYVINRHAEPLIQGNPNISLLLPVFSGSPVPDEGDIKALRDIVGMGEYDAVFNFCPFFDASIFSGVAGVPPVIGPDAMVFMLLYGDHDTNGINSILYQADHFIYSLLSELTGLKRKMPFRGTTVHLSDDALEDAKEFLLHEGISHGVPILTYNPDTTSTFTRVPMNYQADLLKRILGSGVGAVVLMGAGHVEQGIEQTLLDLLPPGTGERIHIIPASMPLDRYVALIDLSDVYITGDTGPLHLASALKASKSGRSVFRNRTAIFSMFGATSSRIYGYDSGREGYLPSYQDAPAKVYVSRSPCRNITCVNKRAKTCRKVRCFDYLDTEQIAGDVTDYLKRGTRFRVQNPESKVQSPKSRGKDQIRRRGKTF